MQNESRNLIDSDIFQCSVKTEGQQFPENKEIYVDESFRDIVAVVVVNLTAADFDL